MRLPARAFSTVNHNKISTYYDTSDYPSGFPRVHSRNNPNLQWFALVTYPINNFKISIIYYQRLNALDEPQASFYHIGMYIEVYALSFRSGVATVV